MIGYWYKNEEGEEFEVISEPVLNSMGFLVVVVFSKETKEIHVKHVSGLYDYIIHEPKQK